MYKKNYKSGGDTEQILIEVSGAYGVLTITVKG